MNLPGIIESSAQWLVIAKPAGWISVPGRGDAPCLSEWLKREYGPVWTVHRLDRDTSGVIMYARTAEAHRRANDWFSGHLVRKIYEFIAHGPGKMPVFKISARVAGAASVTQIEVLEQKTAGFYGRARPLTGRTHQIRKHLAGEGNPLWGDTVYGGRACVTLAGGELAVARVALHARRLELPDGGKFEAPLPEDFKMWLEKLRA